jgi:hypothetical protein
MVISFLDTYLVWVLTFGCCSVLHPSSTATLGDPRRDWSVDGVRGGLGFGGWVLVDEFARRTSSVSSSNNKF